LTTREALATIVLLKSTHTHTQKECHILQVAYRITQKTKTKQQCCCSSGTAKQVPAKKELQNRTVKTVIQH
jgi:hypothetical protein